MNLVFDELLGSAVQEQMTRTLRVLQIRFVHMGVECLSVRAEAHAVLLIQVSNCQRISVSSLYF